MFKTVNLANYVRQVRNKMLINIEAEECFVSTDKRLTLKVIMK